MVQKLVCDVGSKAGTKCLISEKNPKNTYLMENWMNFMYAGIMSCCFNDPTVD